MADDPETAPILKEMRNADGTPRVCERVWISSVGCAGDGWSDVIEQKGRLTAGFGTSPEEIGPEFTFGIYVSAASVIATPAQAADKMREVNIGGYLSVGRSHGLPIGTIRTAC
ncbi:MAG TPA: hypothetical protein PKY77_24760 [Phycisphaerae bacterium]|nr:hypothetical protein [Phycisphaerae bacterium]HRY71407.1 hypothetical protein [Phycisphaerae bacterium]HSA29902.1 hypothetical protein [Phycisphaerae bacterium]